MGLNKKFLFFSILFACNMEHNIEHNNNLQKNNFNNTKVENFKEFLKNFSQDSAFQKKRVISPIRILTFDESGLVDKKIVKINYISFNSKTWGGEVITRIDYVSKDSANVILEVIDTGIHIEYIFIQINNEWYLKEIRDYSD